MNKKLKPKVQNNNNGVTLVALIITIIVLVILATVSIQAINGEGIIGRAQEAAFKAELADLQDKLELYKTGKIIKTSGKFEPTSLSANKLWLFYEPAKYIENGTIEEVMPNISEKMKNKIEVLNGEILFSGTEKEIRWAKEIGINKTVKIENGVLLSDNDNLSILSEDGTFTVPSTVTTVGEGAFSLLGDKIKKVIIPYTVNEIAQNAFYGNTSIEEVEFQTREVNNELKGATKIGVSSFQGCTALKKITLPDSLISIAGNAFNGCKLLGDFELPNKLQTISENAFYACVGLTSLTFPESFKTMGAWPFRECKGLKTVTFLCSNCTMGGRVFWGCVNLQSVKLPEKLTSLRDIFYDCTGLKSIELPEGLKSIEASAFYGCSSLKSILLPTKVTTIGSSAFKNCSSLSKITIPKNVNTIASDAFVGCSSLNNIEFEGENPYFEFKNSVLLNKKDSETTIVYISPNALMRETFEIPDGVTKLDGTLFTSNDGVKKLEIPASVTSININIFSSGITDITIDAGNQNYSTYSGGLYNKGQTEIYYYFGNKETIELSNSLKIIKANSIQKSNTNATAINLPESLTTIENNGINCPNVTTIKIGRNVSSIAGKSALSGGIKTIEIDSNNPNYTFENGGLYNKDKTNLIGVYSLKEENGEQTFTIASTVKIIGDSAFGSTAITKIEIPNSVEEIGNSGFGGCSKLKEITIPGNVRVLGQGSFAYCSSLQTVVLLDGVKTVGDGCFQSCSKLREITIPSTVDSIGSGCFSNCTNLDAININKKRNSISGAPWGAIKGERIINWN